MRCSRRGSLTVLGSNVLQLAKKTSMTPVPTYWRQTGACYIDDALVAAAVADLGDPARTPLHRRRSGAALYIVDASKDTGRRAADVQQRIRTAGIASLQEHLATCVGVCAGHLQRGGRTGARVTDFHVPGVG